MEWTPSIMIYTVEVDYGNDLKEEFHFLSQRRARKFIEKNEAKTKEDRYIFTMHGNQLWLW